MEFVARRPLSRCHVRMRPLGAHTHTQEFDSAREWVGTNLTFDKDIYISVFEVRPAAARTIAVAARTRRF